ncbi:MAG TPA: hypothetical protein VM680_06765 [Verrucomicrobiae bacterium]|nr:hypothetical protein [Verrucomicrobiae bacterium]
MIEQSLRGLQRFSWSVIPLVMLACIVTNARAMTGREKLVTDHSAYMTGEAIKVAFTNGPANPTDRISIYKEGEIPGKVDSTKYLYVGGGSSAGAGVANGEVTFAGGLAAEGNYVAYFLEKDGYRVLAKDAFAVVAPTAPLVRTDKQIYQKGEKITVTFSRGPGNAKDWIAIYAAGVTPGPGQLAFKYVDNTGTGTTGLTDGTVTFDTGLAIPGKWVAYFLENDDYTVLAQDAFEVVVTGNGVVTITPDHQHYLPGQPINISFDGGPGNPKDWIGVYRPGQRPGGPNSTDWRYVNDTQTSTVGLSSGDITLDNGLTGPDHWVGYFFLNDLYPIAGNTEFDVLDATSPLVQTSKRVYDVGEPILISFTNAPANAKDWIGIYPKGVDYSANGTNATLWNYTDGTRTGTAGITEGELTFSAGLDTQDEWTAYLFENDGYTVLAQEDFTVRASGVLSARIVSVSPGQDGVAGPSPTMSVILENRDTTVNTGTISVKLDGVERTKTQTVDGARITVSAPVSEILQNGSSHTLFVSFQDSTGATITSATQFTVNYANITLPPQIYLETFENVAEGSLPAGWVASNQSGPVDVPADLGHLGSLAYHDFTVVDAARLGGDFLTYASGTPEIQPIAQILGPGQPTVVNGAIVNTFASGKILFGASGYHGAGSEIIEVVTRDYNLTDKGNIHLSYHSLYEQNQDNIAGIEVSTDQGATWHPVIYYLDPEDVIKTNGVVDLDATFNTVYTGNQAVATFPDGSGGTYGAFLKAPIDTAVAAAIQPRNNDDPADGTRVEFISVPVADGKANVRFRIFYAGTDSWYLGIDDFGIYGNSVVCAGCNHLSITGNANSITINYGTGVLESTSALGPNAVWTPVQGASNGTYTTTPSGAAQFYRLKN